MPIEPEKTKDIFLAALEKTGPPDRAAYLDEACAGDADLRRSVEALLLVHDQPDRLLDQPAAEHLARQVGTIDLAFLEPGTMPGSLGRLGHYEALEVAGQGGMGIVLRAFDEKLHRVVAIKVLAPALAGSGAARQRFVREARAAAAVTHDNVIAIHGVEEEGPIPYLIMQFIEGCTLQQKLDRCGPLPVKEILRLAVQIADGLAAAHRHGLVHRDIKPANILLENCIERVKITDFGLARVVADASVTTSGFAAGTPAYMSPEQANAQKVDHRSDLFSLGSVLYAVCTGHPPFRADTAMAVLRRVCDDTPRPIRDSNPDVPEWLEALIARLLAKDPAARFATAQEVATLLSRGLTQVQAGAEVTDLGLPVATPPDQRALPGKRFFTAGRLSVAGVVLVGVLTAGWFTRGWWLPAPTPQTTDRSAGQPQPWKPRPPLRADELEKLPDPLHGMRRDGLPAHLLTSVAGDANDALPELVGVLGDGPFRLPQREHTHWPTQSPDGRLLALPCGNTVVLYDASTGAVVRILKGHTHRTYVGDFSPDGKRFACGSTSGAIKVWDVDTGKETTPQPGFQDGENHVWGTLFSPDGKHIVTVGNQGAVKVWDAAGGKDPKTLPQQHKDGATFLAFNAMGTRLATAGVDCKVRVWDWPSGNHLETLDEHTDMIQCLAFSADGALLASGSQSCVVVWDVATLRKRSLPLQTAGGGLLGFTPDGRALVAGPHNLPAGQKRAFKRWDVETEDLSPPITPDGRALVARPHNLVGRLSRDGHTVYLMSYDPPDARLGAYDAVTGGDRFPNQGHSVPVLCVAFSPDGRMLASGDIDGRVCLWDLEHKAGGFLSPRPLTGDDRPVWAVAFSPDGRLLACSSIGGTIRLWNVATGEVQEPPTAPSRTPPPLAFSPDGETLAAGNANGRVHRWVVKTRQPKKPLEWHNAPVLAVAFSPDGRWLASGSADKTVQLIDRASSLSVRQFRCGALVTGLSFSPDSQTLAAALDGSDPSVRLWDVGTGRGVGKLTGHTRPVLGLAFHPAGKRIATGSLDGTARLWETSPGADQSPVFDFSQVAFTPSGRHLVIGTRLYQIDSMRNVAFTPSGRHLAVGLNNGLIAILRTPPALKR
jgi:WD40 repeat protein